jgi:ribosomal protein S18 acetylase RimI-like enzyme
MRSAFICDFYIYPAFQGRVGKQAMAAFEHALKSQGISQIKLRVAGDNRARAISTTPRVSALPALI